MPRSVKQVSWRFAFITSASQIIEESYLTNLRQRCHQHQGNHRNASSLRSFSSSPGPPSTYDPPHPPILFDLVLRADWKSALNRVSSHPIEAKYRHPRGYTLLHCAVEYQAPIELIDKMTKAHPEALEMKDWQGRSIVDVAIDDDTKTFLEELIARNDSQPKPQLNESGNVTTMESGSNITLAQVAAISKQLHEIETSCHQLRIQLDALTKQTKEK